MTAPSTSPRCCAWCDEHAPDIAHLELRLADRLASTEHWLIGLILGVYALVIGTLVAVVFFGLNIISRLPSS